MAQKSPKGKSVLDKPKTECSPLDSVPDALSLSAPLNGKILVAGSCFFDEWIKVAQDIGVTADHFVTAGYLPDEPPHPLEDYAFVIAAMARRHVSPISEIRLPFDDLAAHEQAFEDCWTRTELSLRELTKWSEHLPIFVVNFLVPQFNYIGRLLPRYDIRNPVYFVELLNRRLAEWTETRHNVHLFDVDMLAASYGRQRIQDDSLWLSSHGGLLNDFDFWRDQDRLEKTKSALEFFEISTEAFVKRCWAEAFAMYRTINQVDTVKLVCVDLDDTLWRGVMAERDFIDPMLVEGWPLGLVEALLALRKRGIILAIVSKNDEQRVRGFWQPLMRGHINLEDFAIVKMNWKPKVDNILEAIAEANVLPSSVLFIDDNPVEREAVKAAIPDVRVLGAPHYLWRDTLLRSSETQVPVITKESTKRSEMIKAQILREKQRARLTHDEFLHSLGLTVALHKICKPDDSRMPRAFELVNKTNQFNTTGARWTHEKIAQYLHVGGVWWTFEVADRFTSYGLVGVVAVSDSMIDQFVMSCRVLGMEVEKAVLAVLCQGLLRSGRKGISAALVETAANLPCRRIFADSGWSQSGAFWEMRASTAIPKHIEVRQETEDLEPSSSSSGAQSRA